MAHAVDVVSAARRRNPATVYGGRVERVWDYPRPPAVRPCDRRVRVEWAGEVLADSIHALRVLETSHPPTIYIPPAAVRLSLLSASDAGPTWCEFKGEARYLDAIVAGQRAHAVAWSYAAPTAGYEALRDHVAFYPGRLDAAWLDDERVQAQLGDFYGGWITSGSARSKGRLAPAAGSDPAHAEPARFRRRISRPRRRWLTTR